MPIIRANGIDIYYEIHGEGPPLLMIYGLAGRGEGFVFQIPSLSKHFRTIIFDNRGAGETDQPTSPYSIPLMADDAAGLLDALGIESADVFGISMGGMIAQEFALRHPHRLKRLALGCTHGGIKHCVPSPAWVTEIFKSLPGKPREQVVRDCIPINFSPQTQATIPELIESLIPMLAANRQKAYAYLLQMNAIYAFDAYDRLPLIKAPTLILAGKDDVLIPPGNSLILSERIPDAKLIEYENAGHLFFIEKADEVNRALIDFFN